MVPDDIPARAVRDAVREMAVPGLSQPEAEAIAGIAANRARQLLPANATQTETYAAMSAAAREMLKASAHRQRLLGGIESLPYLQGVAMHLRLLDGKTNEQIAEYMNITAAEVRVLFAQAFEHLWDVT